MSKTQGDFSIKEKELIKKKELTDKVKETELYKIVLKKFPDAELIDIDTQNKKED